MKNKGLKKILAMFLTFAFVFGTISASSDNLFDDVFLDTFMPEATICMSEFSSETTPYLQDYDGIMQQSSSTLNSVPVNGTYYIRNRSTGRVLDVENAAQVNGTQIWQHSWLRGNLAQQWRLVNEGNGHSLAPMCATGSRLDIAAGGVQPGAKVQIWGQQNPPSVATNQRFLLTHQTNGAQSIRRHVAQSTAIEPRAGTASTMVELATYNANRVQQHWYFIPTNNASTITLDLQGGTGVPTSTVAQRNGRVGRLPTPTRTNHRFLGWASVLSSGQMPIRDENWIVTDSNVTLFAQWECIHSWGNWAFVGANCNERRICDRCGRTENQNTHAANFNTTALRICTRNVNCGMVNWSGQTRPANGFTHFMFRGAATNNINQFARYLLSDFFDTYNDRPTGVRHLGFDIQRARFTGSNDSAVCVTGFPVYASGPGRVVLISGSNSVDTGFFVVILYDNGVTARYLHLDGNPRNSPVNLVESTRVTHTTRIGTAGVSGVGHLTQIGRLHFDVNTGGWFDGNIIRNEFNRGSPHVLNPATLFPTGTFAGSHTNQGVSTGTRPRLR
jgi:hypothetical protein